MLNATLYLVRGDDQDIPLTVTNPDGTPYVLSGCSLTFTARAVTWQSPVIIQTVTTNHLVPESGMSQLTFVPANTVGVDDTQHYFDIKLTSTGGRVTTLMNGPLFVRPTAATS